MRSGFSLVEVAISVAIVGIFSAIAVPNFVELKWKAKAAESTVNLSGIKTAELAFEGSFDTYVDCDPNPGVSSHEQHDWNPAANGWTQLGWRPAGATWCSYEVVDATTTDFRAVATCDVNDDGVVARYTATATVEPREPIRGE